MDMDKNYKQITLDLSRESRRFEESEDPNEREQCCNNYSRTLIFIEQLLKGEMPEFYEGSLKNLLVASKKREAEMIKEANSCKKSILDGVGKKIGTAREEKEKLGQGLLDTILSEKPNVKWDDIAGLIEAKKSLYEALIMPVLYPDFFKGNVQPWRGILLYGPPGTGKTFLAKACATECKSTFFSVSSSDLMSKYLGESEKLIKELFAKANKMTPSIIFIDEIDSLCGNRSDNENESSRRVKTEFLVQMQGLSTNKGQTLVLGATNLPWYLDPAIRRRFERRVYIPLPDFEARLYLIKRKLKGLDRKLLEEDFKIIAKLTEGFSGADLEILAREASFEPLRLAQTTNKFKVILIDGKEKFTPVIFNSSGKDIRTCSVYDLPDSCLILPELKRDDLINAFKRSKPSVSQNDIKIYFDWTKQFGISD